MEVLEKKRFFTGYLTVSVLFLMFIGGSLKAETVKNFRILKTDPIAQVAVIRSAENRIEVIKVGDNLEYKGSNFKLSNIFEDRIVLDGIDIEERIIIRPTKEGQEVKRIKRAIKRKPVYDIE